MRCPAHTTSLSDSRRGRRLNATLRPLPSPQRVSPVTRITLPACRSHYPGGSDRCSRRLLPHPCGLPRYAGGSASASSLSRPAQDSLTLRPAGSLSRPRRPLSRGFRSAGYPTNLLVSYQTYRQLSGWIPPPLVTAPFGAHSAIRGPVPHYAPFHAGYAELPRAFRALLAGCGKTRLPPRNNDVRRDLLCHQRKRA
ncbi:hypothetical protein ACVWXO_010121 [Bradyrhizobium sp. LM2.7]